MPPSNARSAFQLALFGGLAATLMVLFPMNVSAEEVGISQADLPSLNGAFSIENSTGSTIKYQIKWGEGSAWRQITLENGRVETHSHALGANGRAPTPFVRFDRIGGDGKNVTFQEYRMQFAEVGYAGYGSGRKSDPKPYVFRYAANGRDLDLKTK